MPGKTRRVAALIAATIAGAQLVHDVGYMDNGTTGALDQLLICHEMIGWVKHYMKHLIINEINKVFL